ncbi:hypothetical protein MBLNU457_5544t2 [Dothideomycetes sp. NU457]
MEPTYKRKSTDESPSENATAPPPPKRQKTRGCLTCEELKPVNQFPLLRDRGHDHERNTCRSCYQDWLRTQMGIERWDEMLCPECETHLSPYAISKILNAYDYSKYERTALVSTLSALPDFTWCTARSCKSGQIHVSESPFDSPDSCNNDIFTCAVCDHKHCVSCKRDWHEDQSCEEAATEDAKRRRERQAEDKASEKQVGKISKPCPGCGVKIEKNGGCINMHCEFTRR